MKKYKHLPPLAFFRRKLEVYLTERHPNLTQAKKFICTRSEKALFVYARALDAGCSTQSAQQQSEVALFEGLIFSKFDTIRCILATEFPQVPAHWQRNFVLELLPVCETIFANYDLSDRFLNDPALNHLIADLIHAIRGYMRDRCGA